MTLKQSNKQINKYRLRFSLMTERHRVFCEINRTFSVGVMRKLVLEGLM